MSKIEQRLPDDWHPDTWSSLDQEQEEDLRTEQREASSLLVFVVLSLLIGTVSIWAGIASGRI